MNAETFAATLADHAAGGGEMVSYSSEELYELDVDGEYPVEPWFPEDGYRELGHGRITLSVAYCHDGREPSRFSGPRPEDGVSSVVVRWSDYSGHGGEKWFPNDEAGTLAAVAAFIGGVCAGIDVAAPRARRQVPRRYAHLLGRAACCLTHLDFASGDPQGAAGTEGHPDCVLPTHVEMEAYQAGHLVPVYGTGWRWEIPVNTRTGGGDSRPPCG